jgi:AcrR family transcriptional regulator
MSATTTWQVPRNDGVDAPVVPATFTGPWRPNAALLLEATINLIDAGGEQAVKVEPLAASLGMSVTMMYRYFGSRQGMVDAAQAERWARSLHGTVGASAGLVAGARSAAEFRKRINQVAVTCLGRQHVGNMLRQANVVGSAYGRAELMSHVVQTTHNCNRELVTVINDAKERGWVVPDADAETIVSWLCSVTFGRVLALLAPEEHTNDDRWLAMTLEPLNQALFAKAAPKLSTLRVGSA